MSSASATITAGYIRTRCSSAVNIANLCSYALQNSGTHRCQTFVYPLCLPPLLLSYIRTQCSSAINIADIRSYALQNLVGMHRCLTFVFASRLLPLPLTTFIRAACLPSTSSTSVRTYCRTPVRTAVRHLYLLRVCCHYRCPTFVRTAHLPSTSPTYVRTHCRTSLVRTAVRHFYILYVCHYYRGLHTYALLVCGQHR